MNCGLQSHYFPIINCLSITLQFEAIIILNEGGYEPLTSEMYYKPLEGIHKVLISLLGDVSGGSAYEERDICITVYMCKL